ncbi:MAG: DUF4339 domain-containing protein [Synergistaceae bacterium]|jgi:hypothetical protein|nr:DUF4339 domain-containing protein [Synergistaceae bacterium]
MKKWYCYVNGQTYGPYDENQLREKAKKGSLTPDSLVWYGDSAKIKTGWVKAGDTEIQTIFEKKNTSQGGNIREEENTNDFKNTIVTMATKTHQMFKESAVGPLYMLFLLFGLLWFIWWMFKNVILVIGLIVLFVLYRTAAMTLRHRRLRRQQDIDILNTDVSKIRDDEAARLAEKYQNQ